MLSAILIVLGTCICILAHDNHTTRRELLHMSIALDNLTAQVANLETQAAAVISHVATLQAAGENAPALDALGTRIKAAADSLQTAVAPKA